MFIVIEAMIGLNSAPKQIWRRVLQTVITFVLMSFVWVFFRSQTASQSFEIVNKIIHMSGPLYLGNPKDHFFYGVLFILLLLMYEFKEEFFPGSIKLLHNRRPEVRYAFYLLSAAVVALFISSRASSMPSAPGLMPTGDK